MNHRFPGYPPVTLLRQCVLAFLLAGSVVASALEYRVIFQPGLWTPGEWRMVKSPRWPDIGTWEQKDDCLTNVVPPDASPEELQEEAAPKTYASMLWGRSIEGSFSVSATLEFDYKMAPLIVLSTPVQETPDAACPEYHEHWEIVLYNQGLNIWHHEYKNGNPCWHLAAATRHSFEPKTRYTLKVQVKRSARGALIIATCGDAYLSYTEHALPPVLFTGITGCEGICRFYDFVLNAP